MPIYAYDNLPPVSSRTSVALRAIMAFAEIEPDEEYMEDMMTSSDTRLAALEPCWYTLKATGREIIEHYTEIGPKIDGHPFWCQPCEGYNVLGVWFECNLQHQMQHRFLWELDDDDKRYWASNY